MPATHQAHVLLIDDEALLRKSLARMLELRGHRVLAAGSLSEARELLDNEKIDAAIIDVGLPDGDGLALLPLTGIERSLVISAEVEESRLDEIGVAHFLRKPLELQSVCRWLEELVLPAVRLAV